jgi:hypothetical protein
MVIYYDNNIGNTSSSTGTNNFLLGTALPYYNSLTGLINKYIPYYIKHDTLTEWEYGLGYVVNIGGENVLVRGEDNSYDTATYSSSNNNSKVIFSAGTKSVVAIISAERINHGGNNYETKTSNFYVDPVQTVYGIQPTGTDITAYLPLASGNKNLVVGFRLLNGSLNNLVISPSGSDLIDGSGSVTLNPNTQYTSLISNNSGWVQLNRNINIDAAGLPDGSQGNIQFKNNSTDFAGDNDLHWDINNKLLLVGGATSGNANIILPADSGHTTIFNKQAFNNDFQVKGTGNNQLYFDASSGKFGINTQTPTTILHIVGKCANDTMKLESSTNCATGVALTLYHNPLSGSEVGDFPATINFAGRDSNGQQINYGRVRSRILGTLINQTSGELVLSVDYLGAEKNIITVSPVRTTLGVNSNTSELHNISIGNFIVNSGSNNIVVGQSANISDVNSTNNIILSNSGSFKGNNSFIAGSNTPSSGTNIYVLGSNTRATGINLFNIGSDNTLNGSNIINCGYSNNTSGASVFALGKNNTVTNAISGIAIGFNNTVQSGISFGSDITAIGYNITCGSLIISSGVNNTVFGIYTDVIGLNNTAVGSGHYIFGTGNIVFGENVATTGTNNIIIGNNLDIIDSNSVVIGIDDPSIVINSGNIAINSGLSPVNISIYGSSAQSGLFLRNNKVGINNLPSDPYVLDVLGSGKMNHLYTETLRVGSNTSGNYILVSDTSGNATWQSPSIFEQNFTDNLTVNGLVSYDGNTFVSTTGLFWSQTSGILYTTNNNTIIPTGNNTFVINNNQQALSNLFNIKGSIRPDLLVVNSNVDRIGINNNNPLRTIDASGTFRVYKDSLNYIEKNDNQFIVAYDNGVAQSNKLVFTSSGIYVEQTVASPQILPEHTFVSTYPTTVNVELVRDLVFDTNDNKLKYRTSTLAGFGAFNGNSDS